VPLKIVNSSIGSFDLDLAKGGSNGQLVHFFGFDPVARFQMIMVGDRRQFSVSGGSPKGFTFKFAPTGKGGRFKFIAQDMDLKFKDRQGLVTIEGVVPGDCSLELVDSNTLTPVDRIDVTVVKFANVVTRFYNLVPKSGGNSVDPKTVTKTKLDDLMDSVNTIVMMQCSVSMAPSGGGLLRDLQVPSFTGGRVQLEDPRQFIALFASSDVDRDAEYHVIFARSIDTGAAAITKQNFTLVKSDVLTRPFHPECTFAHEFVHFLSNESPGPESMSKSLMVKGSSSRVRGEIRQSRQGKPC
jgi:hypothetical protein